LLANEYAREVFWHGRDMVGQRPFDVWPPETAATFVKRAHSVVETQQPLTSEDVLPHPDGERTMLIHRFPLRDTSGETSLIAAIGVDITAEKRAEAEAREAAAQAERAKLEFRAELSEQMRAPLNDVIGYTRLLETEQLNPACIESVNGITTAARQLLALIDDAGRRRASRVRPRFLRADLHDVQHLTKAADPFPGRRQKPRRSAVEIRRTRAMFWQAMRDLRTRLRSVLERLAHESHSLREDRGQGRPKLLRLPVGRALHIDALDRGDGHVDGELDCSVNPGRPLATLELLGEIGEVAAQLVRVVLAEAEREPTFHAVDCTFAAAHSAE
jgi:PAS domain S-box-containing protein